MDVVAVLDTGADLNYVPPEIAEYLGLELEEETQEAESLEEPIPYKLTLLTIQIGRAHEKHKIEDSQTMVPTTKKWEEVILGVPFLKNFRVCFDYNKGTVELKISPQRFDYKRKKFSGLV